MNAREVRTVADLGGVPRVPEPPLVELDTRQADRRRACVRACYVRACHNHVYSCVGLAVVVDSP